MKERRTVTVLNTEECRQALTELGVVMDSFNTANPYIVLRLTNRFRFGEGLIPDYQVRNVGRIQGKLVTAETIYALQMLTREQQMLYLGSM